MLVTTPATGNAAQSDCEADGGNLVTINDDQENAYVKEQFEWAAVAWKQLFLGDFSLTSLLERTFPISVDRKVLLAWMTRKLREPMSGCLEAHVSSVTDL